MNVRPHIAGKDGRAAALEHAYTMGEACDLIPMCRRKLQEFLKSHPFYYENGSRKLFQESDIASIRAALRRETEDRRLKDKKKCPSNSSRPALGKPHFGLSAEPTSGSMWTEAQRRLADLQRQSSSPNGKTKLSLVRSRNPESQRS